MTKGEDCPLSEQSKEEITDAGNKIAYGITNWLRGKIEKDDDRTYSALKT
jgi:O-succinylbenzoate synthase